MGLWGVVWCLGLLKLVYWLVKLIADLTFRKIHLGDYRHGSVCVTGATDGIGKALAREFVLRGFRVLLVSRDADKLKTVREELMNLKRGADVQCVQADFTHSHRNPEEFYADLYAKLRGFNIAILVNNVGVANYSLLPNLAVERIEEMVGVNIYPQVMLTHYLLKDFYRKYEGSKEKSLVIHVSSAVTFLCYPSSSIYSASKLYNAQFAGSLALETAGVVDHAIVYPFIVNTALAKKLNTMNLPLAVSPECYARALLSGLHRGANYGPVRHRIAAWLLSLLPFELQEPLMKLIVPLMKRMNIGEF